MGLPATDQVFDRMSKLAAYAGIAEFWERLTPAFHAKYAGKCRTNPQARLFSLAAFLADAEVAEAVEEYRLEKEIELQDPSNANMEY
jgi:hypothetical protein